MISDSRTRLALALEQSERGLTWMARARDGWVYRYYTGFLVQDRAKDLTADLVGAMFRNAYVRGLVSLTQKMTPEGAQYWARRSAKVLSTNERNQLLQEISAYAKARTDGEGIDD